MPSYITGSGLRGEALAYLITGTIRTAHSAFIDAPTRSRDITPRFYAEMMVGISGHCKVINVRLSTYSPAEATAIARVTLAIPILILFASRDRARTILLPQDHVLGAPVNRAALLSGEHYDKGVPFVASQ